ncbi:MAG: hypothetical protein ACJ8MR_10050, partial [Povalibacter sp.]
MLNALECRVGKRPGSSIASAASVCWNFSGSAMPSNRTLHEPVTARNELTRSLCRGARKIKSLASMI